MIVMFDVTFIANPGGTFCEGIFAQSRPVGNDLWSWRACCQRRSDVPATLIARLGVDTLITFSP